MQTEQCQCASCAPPLCWLVDVGVQDAPIPDHLSACGALGSTTVGLPLVEGKLLLLLLLLFVVVAAAFSPLLCPLLYLLKV